MKDKWLADLKNKFEGHEDDPPDGVWMSIEKELFPEEEGNVFPLLPAADIIENNDDKKHNKKKLGRIIGTFSIAAGIAVLVSVIFFHETKADAVKNLTESRQQKITKDNLLSSSSPDSVDTNSIVLNKSQAALGNELFNVIKANTTNVSHNELHDYLKIQTKGIETENRYELQNSVGNSLMAGMLAASEKNSNNSDSIAALAYSGENLAQIDIYKKSERLNADRKWSLGLISGPPISSSSPSSHQQEGYVMMNGNQLEIPAGSEEETEDGPLGAIFAGNRDEDVKTDIRHRLPVKLGLSVFYQLDDQWSVSTGITYARLSSDLLSGTEANMIRGEQTVKYVGVPVQIHYKIWQKGNTSVYAGAGAQIEKPISGKMKTNYIVNHEVKESFSESFKVNSLQISLNAGGGVQYKIFRNFGIYFEPSLRYNFKDGSEIRTLYREKPLNLNLEFGVRYSIQ
ncbi:PorT family protein [Chryseobacterium herbae]|uniref:PorT family protein n=1 Tax=Chryseobacterium herbae TaxID=2976476 RepID=A0ABT2IX14_9FLAO|nr:PorT family protein [Chryseobacterium sp. pc1-10]MCT2563383.1 PorT family protein [Chryseobacterium sp. pc1-10]